MRGELGDALRAEIIAGQLRPGQALSEIKIAARFGVSRTPVRAVIGRLVAEGLLVVEPQVGTFVAPIRIEAVHDSQFVREALECRAVAIAARQATAEDHAWLRAAIEEQTVLVAARDIMGFFAADDRLHAGLMRMAGRPAVWTLIAEAKAQLDRVRHLSLADADWLCGMLAQHTEIVARVCAGDQRGAEAAMRAHLRTVLAAVETIGRQNGGRANGGAFTSPRRMTR